MRFAVVSTLLALAATAIASTVPAGVAEVAALEAREPSPVYGADPALSSCSCSSKRSGVETYYVRVAYGTDCEAHCSSN
jgi:hypothetical protein